MTEDVVLWAEQLVLERGGRRVLDGASLTLERGRCALLHGPNGGGKSTLLRALAGLLALRAGRIRRAPGVGPPSLVFDQGGLIAGLTVGENIVLPLLRDRQPAERLEARLAWALARFDLGPWARLPAAQATRGLAVRAQLARAALIAPDILLCDAPLDQLDPAGAAEVARLLQRAAAGGAAVLVATNVPERAAGLAADRWTLDQGRITRSVA